MEELTQYVNEGSILPDDYAYDGVEWITVSQLLKDPQRAVDRAQSIANVAKIKYESNYSEVRNKKEIIGIIRLFLTRIETPCFLITFLVTELR